MVSGSLSVGEESERIVHSPFLTYTEQFYEVFPYYLSIGMTYEQFWDGDPYLAKYYRQADEMRIERKNQELWLQGMYFYEALCDVSPILHAMARKGTKPNPYSEQPYPITERQRRLEEEARDLKVAAKGKRMMEVYMSQMKKQAKEALQTT